VDDWSPGRSGGFEGGGRGRCGDGRWRGRGCDFGGYGGRSFRGLGDFSQNDRYAGLGLFSINFVIVEKY
jgi:hypothetical protein